MGRVSLSLIRYVFDSSALINIERDRKSFNRLRRRIGEVVLPEKVAKEVMTPGSPLERLLRQNPDVVIAFTSKEEEPYLRVRSQPGIHDAEAAAIALALSQKLPLVIDESERKARGKAKNHGIRCLSSQDFIGGRK